MFRSMSSVTIITSIIVLLAALVCYAFIVQSLAQKRQKRERVLGNLKTRVRNFKFMLNSVPPGYLPKDLRLLIQRSLIGVLEQLTRLEPADSAHKEDLQLVSQQMAETQRHPETPNKPPIDNPQQSKEIKACLEELYKFVFHLEAKQSLSRPQADSYRAMIKLLVLELTVDSYVLHGRIARDRNKWRLAAHYFDLGLKLLQREGKNGQFDARIGMLLQAVAEMERQFADEQPHNAEVHDDPDQTVDAAWEKFSQQPSWKKKQIYD